MNTDGGSIGPRILKVTLRRLLLFEIRAVLPMFQNVAAVEDAKLQHAQQELWGSVSPGILKLTLRQPLLLEMWAALFQT